MVICDDFVYIKERDVRFDKLKEEYLLIKGCPEDIAREKSFSCGNISFRIEHKENKVPPMHFLNEDEMMVVYDLIKKGHMRFGNCGF